jgi:hypothetical protein
VLDWESLGAFLSGVASVIGATFAIKAVVKHEQKACDTRLDAYKEGMEHGEHEHDRQEGDSPDG